MSRQSYVATSVAQRLPAVLASASLLTCVLGYKEEAVERRLAKLRAGQEDEWRELWIWGYASMVACWLFIAPRMTKRKFPWTIRDRTLQFLTVRRRFEKFVGADSTEPALPKASFQHRYRLTRPFLYTGILRTSLLRGHTFILGSGALAMTMAWWLRSAYYIHFKNSYDFLVPEAVRGNFAAGGAVYKVLVPLTSFLLTLYLVFNVSRLYRIMDLAWKVQGRIYDTAILVSTLLMPHCEDTRVQHACWEVHRFLNLAHLLAYEEISESVKNATDNVKNISFSGFLHESEESEFSELTNCRFMIVFVWLSDLTNRLVEARIVPQAFSEAILEALAELSDATLEFQHEVASGPPVIVRHLMQYMADMMCILTPAMLAGIFRQDDPSALTYLWPWAGSMVVAFFFQGIISFCQALEMPFRDHRDGLDPDWALMTTERQTFGCLSGGEVGGPAPPDSMNLMQPAGAASPPVPASPVSPRGGLLTAPAEFDDRMTSSYTRQISPDSAGTESCMMATTTTISPVLTQIGHGVHTDGEIMSPRSQMMAATTTMSPRSRTSRRAPAMVAEIFPQLRKEKVPMEILPTEAPWAPRELEAALGATATGHVAYADRSRKWGTLNQDLLQATRAALLVPREITLDDISMERLETVSARPLSDLAEKLLNVEPGAVSADADTLMLTEGPHTEGHRVAGARRRNPLTEETI